MANVSLSLYRSVLVFAVLFMISQEAQTASSGKRFAVSSPEVRLYAAPDQSSSVISVIKRGDFLSPVGEIVTAEGTKWYMVQGQGGAAGWLKRSDNEESIRLESYFKSLSLDLPQPILPDSTGERFSSDPVGTIRVPARVTGSSVIVPVTLNRKLKAFLLLDTGATTTMIAHRIASQLGMRTDGPRVVTMTAGGNVSMPLARLGSLKVGEAEVHNLTVTIHDLPPSAAADGLLGLDFLRRFHVSIDSRNQLLTLAPR